MLRRPVVHALSLLLCGLAPLAGRGADAATVQKHPDVLSATVRTHGSDTFDFDVTVSSRYDTPQRYADGFRISGKDGKVYGERTLWHDHAGEQPFTRDLYGVKIAREVRVVVIQARDKQYGYGGRSVEVALPGR